MKPVTVSEIYLNKEIYIKHGRDGLRMTYLANVMLPERF